MIMELQPGYKNTYTCQFCGKTFQTSKDLIICFKVQPVCSYKCYFNVVYHLLAEYPDNWLICLKEYFSINKNEDYNRKTHLFLITKKYLGVLK